MVLDDEEEDDVEMEEEDCCSNLVVVLVMVVAIWRWGRLGSGVGAVVGWGWVGLDVFVFAVSSAVAVDGGFGVVVSVVCGVDG